LHPLHSLPITLTGDNIEQKREEVRAYFHNSYDLYESLFETLKDDSVFYEQSEITRHPMIFYFGHTATFFINKLIVANVITERLDAVYESMFAVGVDEMIWDDMQEAHYRWPEVSKVREYRDRVRAVVDELISTLPLTLPIKQEDPFWIILMGIEHERIHIETSSVLHRQLPIEKVVPVEGFEYCKVSGDAPQNQLVAIEGATMQLGKERDHHLYGWDNEYGSKKVEVAPFKASKYLVSNGEYMAFVQAGGYENEDYWDEEGRAFLKRSEVKHPTFWVQQEDGSFKYRAMSDIIEMPENWPVDVNALEAEAFCRYISARDDTAYRLPTEAEYYKMYQDARIDDVPAFNDDKANINLKHFASSSPVDMFSFGALYDVVGNVWQWSASTIDAFEGFEIHPAYDDFSLPTFDQRHNLIKGGSWISTGNEMMKHSRYAFRKHFYQHAGFRYVEAQAVQEENDNIYESDALVAQYCEFQYGESHFGVENFALRCAQLVEKYTQGASKKSALDLGCATGRASFELAKQYDAVTGIDFSARFIQVAVKMHEKGCLEYLLSDEGELKVKKEVCFEPFKAANVSFFQGDACNLKEHFRGYDLIMATNLIDRLYDPRLFLDSVHERINEGGSLILTSPYTWQVESTQKEKWVGGFEKDGVTHKTLDGLKTILSQHFEFVAVEDVDFVIRETPRKFQHTIAQMSVWKKR